MFKMHQIHTDEMKGMSGRVVGHRREDNGSMFHFSKKKNPVRQLDRGEIGVLLARNWTVTNG